MEHQTKEQLTENSLLSAKEATSDINTATPNAANHHLARHQLTSLTAPKKEIQRTSLFIAIGLSAHEPGHKRIAETVQSLGPSIPYHESLWRVNSMHDMDKAFKQINTSMIDRRIDGTAGLLMLNANEGHVKWHLHPQLSEMIKMSWHQRNNLFISFTLHNPQANYARVSADIQALGMSAPIGKSIWYSSSAYSSKEAFQILISSMDAGDELMVFDERGNMALWHDGHSRAAQAYRQATTSFKEA